MDKLGPQSCIRDALYHIKNDVQYPATKDDIMRACSNISDVPAREREWLDLNIPNRTFGDPTEVIIALFDKI
ncbi:MAG: hypothetical protein ACQCN6_11070 [Candidatus Bathyarchaeia archaeon]